MPHVKKFVPMTRCDEPVGPDHNVSVPDMVDINTDEQFVQAHKATKLAKWLCYGIKQMNIDGGNIIWTLWLWLK